MKEGAGPKAGSGSGRLWRQFLEHLRASARCQSLTRVDARTDNKVRSREKILGKDFSMSISVFPKYSEVPRGGIEPPTPAFSVQCSTN
jgi:hypothetical protein